MSRQADGAQTLSVALRVPCIDGQRYISTGGAASPLISSALFFPFLWFDLALPIEIPTS